MKDVQYSGARWDLRKTDTYTADTLLDDVYTSHLFSIEKYKLESQRQFKKTDEYLSSL